MALVLLLGLQALATAAVVFPENEANDDAVTSLPHTGDMTDLVLHTEADAHKSATQQMKNDALGREAANLEDGLRTAEHRDQMMHDSERLEIEARDARKANMKRKLVQIARGYKDHLFSLNDELHSCSKSHESIAEQLRYSRSKLESVHGLINQETTMVSAVKNRYGGLAQDLRKAYETDDKRIGGLVKDLNQSTVELLSAQRQFNAEQKNATSMSAMVNTSGHELISRLVSNQKNRTKLNELEDAAKQVNSSILKMDSKYRKWSQSLEVEQQQFKSKGTAAATKGSAETTEVRRLVQEAGSVGSILTAAESKRKSMQAQVEQAQKLLAKDAELISRFEIRSQEIKAEAASSCKQQKQQIQGELDSNAEVLEAALEGARTAKQQLQDENQRLNDEIKALRLEAAAAAARAKEAAAEEAAKAAAEEARKKKAEADAKAKIVTDEVAAKKAAEEEKAKAKALQAKAKTEAEAKAKAEKAKAEAEAKAKAEAAAADDQDKVVDQELEAPEVPEKAEPKTGKDSEAAAHAQEEVDRAWSAEHQRKAAAEAKAVPKPVSAHVAVSQDQMQHTNDHRKRVDDVEREVEEELHQRHTEKVSQEFTKMTVETMESSKSKKDQKTTTEAPSSKVSSWSDFVEGKGPTKGNGFAAHPNPKISKFLDLSDSY